MSTLFWVDIISFSLTTVLATLLALMVLGAGPRSALNRYLALFVLMEAISPRD
jgi:hypothetical protein